MGRDNHDDKNKIKRRKVSSSNKRTTSQTSSSSRRINSSTNNYSKNSNNSSRSNNSYTRKSTTSSKNYKKQHTLKKSSRFKGVKTLGVVFLVLLIIGVAICSGVVFASLRDTENVTKAFLEKKTYQTTRIYYADGELLGKAQTANKKEPVNDLNKISKNLQHALIAAEDERFYEHNGVDIKGLLRSVLSTLSGHSQGGSTVPMQISKMLVTSQEKSITRKIKDIYYAYDMSKNISKEDLLLIYLNNFYVGRGLSGAQAGAQGYFNKDAKDLTAGEAALLMAATNNPGKYSPYEIEKLDGSETKDDLENKLLFYANTQDDDFDEPTQTEINMIQKLRSWNLIDSDTYSQLISSNPSLVVRKAVPREAAKKKQIAILNKMLRLGYISQSEYDEEVAKPIEINLPKTEQTVVSSVEDYVYYEVKNALIEQGYTKEEAENMYYNGGLKIYTTIDSGMQKNLEKQYSITSNFPNSIVGADGVIQPQSAMVILDYRTGQIKSLIGGRNVKGKRTLNRATHPEQPGSTIKPLSVYTPAIDTLVTTQSTAFSDAKGGYKFEKNKKWNPNTTTAGSGMMSTRKALAMSSNTIAVKVAETLGDSYSECTDIMIDYLKNFGISTLLDSKTKEESATDRYFPSLVLGGMAYGISPLEMAAAYGTLANGGTYIEPTIFTTVTTYDENILIKANPDEHKVVNEDVAYVITDMLQAVIKEGTGKNASLGKMAVAGKTGTTNNALDCWFVGYTPYYVGATYMGDDAGKTDSNGNKIERRSVEGTSSTVASLWAKVMKPIHANLTTVSSFTKPDDVYFTKINPDDGGTSSYGVKAAFIEGTYPQRASYQSVPTQQYDSDTDDEEPSNTTGDGNDSPPDDEETPSDNPTPENNTNNNDNNTNNSDNNNNSNNSDNNNNSNNNNNNANNNANNDTSPNNQSEEIPVNNN